MIYSHNKVIRINFPFDVSFGIFQINESEAEVQTYMGEIDDSCIESLFRKILETSLSANIVQGTPNLGRGGGGRGGPAILSE